jgi:hypothetical protein
MQFIAALSGPLIPGLIVTYLSMIAALMWADRRPTMCVDSVRSATGCALGYVAHVLT